MYIGNQRLEVERSWNKGCGHLSNCRLLKFYSARKKFCPTKMSSWERGYVFLPCTVTDQRITCVGVCTRCSALCSNCRHYDLFVTDFMRRNLVYLSYRSTYLDLKQLLLTSNHASYPLVDAPGRCGNHVTVT